MAERILVVDDNPANTKLMRVLLEVRGFAVDCAADADEARAALARRLPDLILMDLQLPGTDGYALTRELREAPSTAALPIVAVSAYAMKSDEERAVLCGCNGFLTKPIDTRTFVSSIVGFMNAARDGGPSGA